MITIILVNLVGVTIHVAGVGMCLRATKRTGNNGYLLLAGYFAFALVVASMSQIRELERGPVPPPEIGMETPAVPPPATAEDTATGKDDEVAAQPPTADKEPEAAEEQPELAPVLSEADLLPPVSIPFLPALLLAGVYLVSRDDPRRQRELADAESKKEPSEEPSDPGKGHL
jgi:hypothetical protein